MHPPILSLAFEERNSKPDHQGWHFLVVSLKGFEILGAIPKKPFDVIMLPFKDAGKLHQDQLNVGHFRRVILIPSPNGSIWGRGPTKIRRLRY